MGPVEHTIPLFMQYGAMGILALAFITVLVLSIRSDKRAEKYVQRLEEAGFDRTQLITVVKDNAAANAALATQIENLSNSQARNAVAFETMTVRLNEGECPFKKERRR